MATEFDNTEELHYVGFYTGVVVDNLDPERLGRVRLRVPSIIEPASAWAFPVGTQGGGSAQRGWFDPPDIGAEVDVWFFRGDVDRLFFASGHWGIVDGAHETPLHEDGLSPADRLKIKGYETERYQMIFDHRDGKEQFAVVDKITGDSVAMSPTKTVLKHSKLVVVDAPKVFLGGDDLNENPAAGEGVVLASGVDTFSGKTHGTLNSASKKVFASKG